jgi:hypothetical protein
MACDQDEAIVASDEEMTFRDAVQGEGEEEGGARFVSHSEQTRTLNVVADDYVITIVQIQSECNN